MMDADPVHYGAAVGGSLILVLLLAGIWGWFLVLLRIRRRGFVLPLQITQLQARHWTGHDLLVTGIWVSSALVLFAASGLYMRRVAVDAHIMHVVAALQNTVLQVLVMVLLYVQMRDAGANLETSFGISIRKGAAGTSVFRQAGRWYLLSLPLVFLAAFVSQVFFALQGHDRILQPALELFTAAATPSWFRWWIVGVAVVGAPVIEEAVFRGVLLPVLLRKYAVMPALLASALLFALVHGHALATFPLFVLGLGLGGAYLYTGNLLVPIYMHAFFNMVNLFMLQSVY